GWRKSSAPRSSAARIVCFRRFRAWRLSYAAARFPIHGIRSQLRRGKGVAAPDLARLQAGIEPALALLGAPVREGVGNDVALRLALERIVTDRGRGAQGNLHVAGFDEQRLALAAQILVLVVRPDAGEAISLQLDLHLDVVGIGRAAGRALRL